MAIPEKPLTRRETYLAKAAGQDVTLPEKDLTREESYWRAIAEGGGGGVTPEYVAEAIAEAKADIEAEIPTKTSDLTNDSGYTAINDTTAAQDKTYSSAKVEEKVAGEEITTTATGSDLTLSTSSGNINALTVYGKSEVVDGSIKSAGEGWNVVRLADLPWSGTVVPNLFQAPINDMYRVTNRGDRNKHFFCGAYPPSTTLSASAEMDDPSMLTDNAIIFIYDTRYSQLPDFVASLGDATLAYQLADSTQGNAIAIKTDNGTGINGTMAVFSTGTPLRGIPDTSVRDVMVWNGSAGTVTKVCGKVRLADLTWLSTLDSSGIIFFYTPSPSLSNKASGSAAMICTKYRTVGPDRDALRQNNKAIAPYNITSPLVAIRDDDYTTVSDFVASLGDAELVYELETPITEQLTATENATIATLRTFEPQTHAQNNAGATMTVEAYAGTANGQAVQELKQDVQSEITALKITQSDTLTLTVADWSNNTQTVTYAHDTAKRNVIDVDPSSVEEWASCGVLAISETATGITFTCKTVPENALTFRVTSMGVN